MKDRMDDKANIERLVLHGLATAAGWIFMGDWI
jgi:hypothetical protein